MFKVVVTDDRFGSYLEEKLVFNDLQVELIVLNCHSEDALITGLADADGVLVNMEQMTSKVIGQLKKCKIISRYGAGYDNVDVNAATKNGIWVSVVPDYSVEDVADHSLALLLSCIRKIPIINRKVRKGKWNIERSLGISRISGKTLGIIGYGRIGRAFHEKTKGLGLGRVLVYDPHIYKGNIIKHGANSVSLEELLEESDYISIHIPLNNDTRGLLGKEQFNLIKSGMLIINTSRGAIIDEAALLSALQSGAVAGAGLDVFDTEPLPDNFPFFEMENVILTSHMAYYSKESVIDLKRKAAMNIFEVLEGRPPLYPVNKISRGGL